MRTKEGWLMIDHRESPGIAGTRKDVLGAGKLYESATFRCGHCPRGVVMRPDRTRRRGYCSGCDMLLCDTCSLRYKMALKCESFEKFVDEYLNAAVKGKSLPQLHFL